MQQTYCIKDSCYALLDYKAYIDEVLSDIFEIASHLFIEKNREEYYGEIFRGYANLYKCNKEVYVAEIIVIEPIDCIDRLYTFVHEAGHIVNKHYSGNYTPEAEKQREIEADTYAQDKFNKWGIELSDGLKIRIRNRRSESSI